MQGTETYKSSGFFTYRQVQDLKTMHGAHIAFMWFLSISEKEIAIFALYNINRLVLNNGGGKCLLPGT